MISTQVGTLGRQSKELQDKLRRTEQRAKELERKAKMLVDGITKAAKKHGHAICGDYAGGMFGWYFVDGPVKNFQDATKADAEKFGKWHRMMLERGVYLAPSMYEAGFMSAAHTDEDIKRTIEIADEVLSQL